MNDNARLFFSFVWMVASGFVFATGLVVLVSWGDHLDYLYASLIVWGIASAGALYTSL